MVAKAGRGYSREKLTESLLASWATNCTLTVVFTLQRITVGSLKMGGMLPVSDNHHESGQIRWCLKYNLILSYLSFRDIPFYRHDLV